MTKAELSDVIIESKNASFTYKGILVEIEETVIEGELAYLGHCEGSPYSFFSGSITATAEHLKRKIDKGEISRG